MGRELYESEAIPNRIRSLTRSDLRVTFLLITAAAVLMQLIG